MKVGLFQFEMSHPNQAPHIGMCLMVPDLKRQGHAVDAYLVARTHVEVWIEHVAAAGYGLVALDSIFPAGAVNRLKARVPEVPVVVGGVNAPGLFLASAADFCVAGAGRRALTLLVDALAAGTTLDQVPNLFWRRRDRVERSAVDLGWTLAGELEPYAPEVEWGYLGGERPAGANTHQLSVVAELGCVYQEDAAKNPIFLDLAGAPRTGWAGVEMSERAERALSAYISNNRGCSFCVFRFQDFTHTPTAETVEQVIRQMDALAARYGARQFSVQSENPLRFLGALLDRLESRPYPVEALSIRTLPLILLQRGDALGRALTQARRMGITIVLQQLGFESFDDEHLARFNKGITAAQNRQVARQLATWAAEFPETLDALSGHGLILFDPWTSVGSLARNAAAIAADAPFLEPALSVHSRLVFYDPFNPIFRLADQAGLVVKSEQGFGWDFRFADAATADFVGMVHGLNAHLAKRLGGSVPRLSSRGTLPQEPWIFRQALALYQEAGGEPAVLRRAFFDIAQEIDARLEASR